MTLTRAVLLSLALGGCAHTKPDEMTASEHRAESARHQQTADNERSQFEPGGTRPVVAPRTPFEGDTLRQYNPSVEHLNEADRQMRAAFEHLKAAQALESYEDVACAGVPIAERTACPVLAPHTEWVEEISQGLTIHLKASALATAIAAQMQCHLAFAQARGFDRAPCPLYVKGVKITADGRAIEVRSLDPKVASQVRAEGRKMFGEPAGTK